MKFIPIWGVLAVFKNRTPIRTRIAAFCCFGKINIEKVYQNAIIRVILNLRKQLMR
jgi:hypothetical protein